MKQLLSLLGALLFSATAYSQVLFSENLTMIISKLGNQQIRELANWEISKLGNWEISKLGNQQIGKLANWEISKLGNWEISKLGNQQIRCFGVIPKNQILETQEEAEKWRKREKY